MRSWLCKFICAIVLASTPVIASDFKPTREIRDESEVLKSVLDKLDTKVVDPASMPALYAAMDERQQAANQALDALALQEFGVRVAVPSQLVVLDYKFPQAAVSLVKGPDGKTKLLILVSQGLIDLAFREPPHPGESVAQAGLRLIGGGVLHEMGHVIDYFDPQGFEQNSSESAAQAIELRADYEATKLERLARFEPGSTADLLKALRRYTQNLEKAGNPSALKSAMGYFGSHPVLDLRISTLTLAKTAQDFQKGEHEVSVRPLVPEVSAEAKALHQALETRARKSEFPDSVEGTLIAIRKKLAETPGSQRKGGIDGLEHLQKLLIARGNALTAQEKMDVIRFQLEVNEDTRNHGAVRTQTETGSEYRRLMEQVPFFRTEEYQGRIRKEVLEPLLKINPAQDDASGRTFQEQLRRFLQLVPAESLIGTPMGQVLGQKLAGLVEGGGAPGAALMSRKFGLKAQGMGDAYAAFYQEEIFPSLSASARARVRADHWGETRDTDGFDTSGKFQPEMANPFFRYDATLEEGAGALPLREAREALLKRLTPRLRQSYAQIARQLWSDRAKSGLLDLMGSGQTDWGLVFSLLDINPEQGRAELARSVRAFVATPEYATFLRAIQSDTQFSIRSSNRLDPPRVAWLPQGSAAIHEELAGTKNPAIASDPVLHEVALGTVAGRYAQSDQPLYVSLYREGLRAALQSHGQGALSSQKFLELNHQVIESIRGSTSTKREVMSGLFGASELNRELDRLRAVLAQELASSALTLENKRDLLKTSFIETLKPHPSSSSKSLPPEGLLGPEWFGRRAARIDANESVIQTLVSTSLLNSPDDFVREYILNRPVPGEKQFAALATLSELFLKELVKARVLPPAERLQRIKALIDSGLGPAVPPERRSGIPSLHDLHWLKLKNSLATELADLKASPPELTVLFEKLTGSGATPVTDGVFRTLIRPLLDKSGTELVSRLLKNRAIGDSALQLELATAVLEPKLRAFHPQKVTTDELKALLGELDQLMPATTQARDKWIETTLERLQVNDRTTTAMAETFKSTYYRKRNPIQARWASLGSEVLAEMSPAARADLANYLADPRSRAFPESLAQALRLKAQTDLKFGFQNFGPEKMEQLIESQIATARSSLITFALESTPEERFPAIHHLLTEGRQPLAELPEYPLNFIRGSLGFVPDSPREKILLAFMKTLPPEQRSAAVAFMLAQGAKAGGSLKSIFEVFGAVGRKMGQSGSLWKLFGEEASRELAGLKSNAQPPNWDKILKTMDTTLTVSEKALIKGPVKILGSASIKTAVLVELKDGRKVVMMMRRADVEGQNKANLERARKLLDELRETGMEIQDQAFHSMVDDLESQLSEEIRFKEEIAKIRQAKEIMKHLNVDMKGELGNWKFKVPDAAAGFEIRDDLVFMDYAEGQTLDRMPENSKLRKWAGKTAAKGALRGLWKYGWFDADRHAGNWIVDPETQTIHLIDLGEGEVFSKTPGNLEADEVYNLAQFLINVKAKNISEIVRFGVALSKNAQPAAAQRKNLEKRIAATFQKGLSSQDEALELVTDFAESGIKLKRKVSFGALKGLTVIRQENYLPGRSFEASMLKEMAGAMLRKGPLFLRDAARGCLGGVVGVLLRRR